MTDRTTKLQKKRSMRNPTSSIKPLITAAVVVIGVDHKSCQAQSYALCNASADSCPFQGDGECDNESGLNVEFCSQGDCFDCDRCQVYNSGCSECVKNGCYWCPGDASCLSSTNYKFTKISSCLVPSDYRTTCKKDNDSVFSDPLNEVQAWVYDLINVVPVWKEGITGDGSRIRINDSGVLANHEEFAGRFDVEGSCSDSESTFGYESRYGYDDHGTVVASIAAAAGDNDICTVGIAPKATISSCFAFDLTDQSYTFLDFKLDSFDVSVNSYNLDACLPSMRRSLQGMTCPFTYVDPVFGSPCEVCDFGSSTRSTLCEEAITLHCTFYYENDPDACLEHLDLLIDGGECQYNTLTEQQAKRIRNAILRGRDGKGIIFIFAAGNEYDRGEDVNFEGFLNTRFTITVGAVGKDGFHASYSTPGAGLFVTAPGGDLENLSNFITAGASGGCRRSAVGTSLSAPVVSGVVALMLEVNPALGWRDVQGILAVTSKVNENDSNDDTRVTNAAGLTHSNFYGFGLVNAEAAVNAAKSWKNYGLEQMVMGESDILNLAIPDDPTFTATSSISITAEPNYIAESVVVYLDLRHASRGDLDVVLTSPHGTESLLHPGKRPETTQPDEDEQWKLLTVRNWGELASGNWSLSITDISPGYVSDCIDIPWEVFTFNTDVNCDLVEVQNVCRNGKLNEGSFSTNDDLQMFTKASNDDGLTALDACCACGGGANPNTGVDILMKWRLVVYGHTKEFPSPTSSPTIIPIPTDVPTSSSSRVSNSNTLAFILFCLYFNRIPYMLV